MTISINVEKTFNKLSHSFLIKINTLKKIEIYGYFINVNTHTHMYVWLCVCMYVCMYV